MPLTGVAHPYLARALMVHLDFKGRKEATIVALCDAVKNGWHGEIVPETSPKGQSKSDGEVERAVQFVHGLVRTLEDFPGAEIWNCAGVPESVVGLSGRALPEPSHTFLQR